MYYVYVIKSIKNGNLYYGYSADLKRRMNEHNNGKTLSTKAHLPWELVYYEAYKSGKDAQARERQLKNYGQTLSLLKKRISGSLG